MVLLIIIPMKNCYFIGNIPNIFRQTHLIMIRIPLRLGNSLKKRSDSHWSCTVSIAILALGLLPWHIVIPVTPRNQPISGLEGWKLPLRKTWNSSKQPKEHTKFPSPSPSCSGGLQGSSNFMNCQLTLVMARAELSTKNGQKLTCPKLAQFWF